MSFETTLPPAARVGRSYYSTLVAFPVTCFVLTLATDLAYWATDSFLWETISVWLLTVGLIVFGVAIIAGIVDLVRSRRVRVAAPPWPRLLGQLVAFALSLVNVLVHSRDGYTAVVPQGLILSAVVVLVLLVTAFPRRAAARRAPRARWRFRLMRYARPSRLALAAALGAAACGTAAADPNDQLGADPKLPAPHEYLMPPVHIATRVPWGDDTPKAPGGLQVRALASDLANPRFLYVLPNGDILVVETKGPKAPVNRPKDLVMKIMMSFADSGTPGANRITLLRDIGPDGVAKTRTTFLDHLNSPFGVVLVGNALYVADTDALLRFPYKEGETAITEPATKVTDLPAGPIDHHWTKSLTASADGKTLYVGVGSNSNITENGLGAELDRAAIWAIDPAAGMKREYATGVRNPTGLQIEPKTGTLWAIANERDELGPDLVPDYLTSVQDGGFYGWPYSYWGQHVDPRVMPQRPDLVAKAIAPDYALSSHVAPLGFVFATGSALGAAYADGAFVGEHGSWDRVPLNGYKVVYVPFKDGKPSGPPQDFLTGFLTPDDHARGRPVGVAVDKTGALLVADDLGDKVWRVAPAGR